MEKHQDNKYTNNHGEPCSCSEDDNCGCTYPENITSFENTEEITRTQETFKIKTPERFIAKDTVCYCDPKNCDCTITYEENDTQ